MIYSGKNHLIFKGKVKDLLPMLKSYPNLLLSEVIRLNLN